MQQIETKETIQKVFQTLAEKFGYDFTEKLLLIIKKINKNDKNISTF